MEKKKGGRGGVGGVSNVQAIAGMHDLRMRLLSLPSMNPVKETSSDLKQRRPRGSPPSGWVLLPRPGADLVSGLRV